MVIEKMGKGKETMCRKMILKGRIVRFEGKRLEERMGKDKNGKKNGKEKNGKKDKKGKEWEGEKCEPRN